MSALELSRSVVLDLIEDRGFAPIGPIRESVPVFHLLDAGNVEIFCYGLRALDTPEAASLSQRIGLAMLNRLITINGVYQYPPTDSYLATLGEITVGAASIEEALEEAMLISDYCENMLSKNLDALEYHVLFALAQWLFDADCGVDDSDAFHDLQSEASGAAARVYYECDRALVWAEYEMRAAVDVAEEAIDGERQWRKGTRTHFTIVQDRVEDAVERLAEKITRNLGQVNYREEWFREAIRPVIEQARHG